MEESQKAVTLARKAAEFAEEAARRAIQKMQTEAEEREPYFVNLGARPQPRSVEDRHMVRFGPELASGTFLCMLGPVKAAELAANKEQVSWLSAVAAGAGEQESADAVQVSQFFCLGSWCFFRFFAVSVSLCPSRLCILCL